jgi:hypothetical protein
MIQRASEVAARAAHMEDAHTPVGRRDSTDDIRAARPSR